MTYRVQDLGDGEGLDILDEDHEAVEFGRTREEVVDFFRERPGDELVLVLGGALGRDSDEEVRVDELIAELEG